MTHHLTFIHNNIKITHHLFGGLFFFTYLCNLKSKDMKPFKYKNNKVGAKVSIPKLLKSITPARGWSYLKNITGRIVERGDHEHYYHTSSGGNTHPRKHIIANDCHPHYAIKLDNDVTDIEGNNIVVIREWDLKFLEEKQIKKPISKRDYNKALKIIQEYESYEELKRIGKW